MKIKYYNEKDNVYVTIIIFQFLSRMFIASDN